MLAFFFNFYTMKQIKIFLSLLLLPLWIVLITLKKNPQWVEFYYSNGLYPKLFLIKDFFFNKIPFSVGDLFYSAAIILIIIAVVKWIKKPKKKFLPSLLNLTSGISVLLLFFHFSWGFNYYRTPLNEALNYDLKYTEKALIKTLNTLIKTSNTLHSELAENDSLAVIFPYSNTQLNSMIIKDYRIGEQKELIQPGVKASLWSTLLSYMGYAGYLNPFTLESQVNSGIPKISLITTMAHEMAHQVGYAAENEANFIAFMNTVQNEDPYIQYAGYTFGLRYCYYELSKVNRERASEEIKTIHPGILKNFSEIRDFWVSYENPFEPVLKIGYDSYLKANGQKSGIQSYNEMVAYVINYIN